jgi:hypothetical protein
MIFIYPFGTSSREHAHKHSARWSVLGLCHGPNFTHISILVRLPLLEDIDMIGAHLLLSNENLLTAINNEISSLIIRALSKLSQILL